MIPVSIITHNNKQVAQIESTDVMLNTAQDVVEFLAEYRYQGVEYFIIRDTNLPATFFDLQSGLAGDVLQKVSNYRLCLAIVGDYTQISSTSLRYFIHESNRQGRVLFVPSAEEALRRWTVSSN